MSRHRADSEVRNTKGYEGADSEARIILEKGLFRRDRLRGLKIRGKQNKGTGSEVCISGVMGYYKAFLGSKVSLE